jgi:hypothetical protein
MRRRFTPSFDACEARQLCDAADDSGNMPAPSSGFVDDLGWYINGGTFNPDPPSFDPTSPPPGPDPGSGGYPVCYTYATPVDPVNYYI